MKESNLQEKIMAFCKYNGILCYKFASPSRRGVPDLLIVDAGRCLFMEVKHPNGKGRISPLQARELKRLEKNGTPACVVDALEAAQEYIIEWLNSD